MGIGLERNSGTKFDKMRVARHISTAQLMNFQTVLKNLEFNDSILQFGSYRIIAKRLTAAAYSLYL